MGPMMRLHALLPAKENFTSQNAGAVALTVKNFLVGSAYHSEAVVIGRPFTGEALGGISYQPIRSWHRYIFGRNKGLAYGYLRWLKTLAPNARPQLIEVHGRCKLAGMIARAVPDIPVALVLHNDPRDMTGARTATERLQLTKDLAAVIGVSDYLLRCFKDGLPSDAMGHCGFHLARFGMDRPVASSPKKDRSILLVARMVPEKGVLEAAEAAAEILPDFPDWQLQIIGARRFEASKQTPYEKQVQAALAPLGVQAKMLGHLPLCDVQQYQAKAAIILAPSQWQEPAGWVVVEALIAGAALITANRGGIPEYADGRAILLDTPDSGHIAAALRGLLSEPDTMIAMQQKASDGYPFTAAAMIAGIDAVRVDILDGILAKQAQ